MLPHFEFRWSMLISSHAAAHRGTRHQQADPAAAENGGRGGDAPAQRLVGVDHDHDRAIEQARQAALQWRGSGMRV